MNVQKITPFLWFDASAEEAMNFYLSIFKNAQVIDISRQRQTGAVFSVTFELEGQRFIGMNGGPHFRFNEAVSFFVNCETQEEVDELWEKLSAGGQTSRCGWLKDKFGLSWQIVPMVLGQMLQDKDADKSKRVMNAMLQMTKLDIAGLKRVYDQD